MTINRALTRRVTTIEFIGSSEMDNNIYPMVYVFFRPVFFSNFGSVYEHALCRAPSAILFYI
jgi:Kef-type K+ transport system membrane component KefB